MNAADAHRMEVVNRRYGTTLTRLPESLWPSGTRALSRPPREVWRSRAFLVQVYHEGEQERLTVCRTSLNPSGDGWAEGISWEELQRLKWECGRGASWAVELYPPDQYVVNDANMRHLWLIAEPPYGWKRGTP
jgi:hypothetical protein